MTDIIIENSDKTIESREKDKRIKIKTNNIVKVGKQNNRKGKKGKDSKLKVKFNSRLNLLK